MAARKREPKVYRLGTSLLRGRVFVGWARGNRWVGPKRDVTDSFVQTMLDWLGPRDGGAFVGVSNTIELADGTLWNIQIRSVKPKKGRHAQKP